MQVEQEPLYPSKDLLNLVEKCISNIKPDIPDLFEWHISYVKNHKERIALDFRIIKQNLSLGSTILEIGSIPLLLTAVLAQSNYSITGVDIAPSRYARSIQELGVKVISCDIEKEALPISDEQYDAVIFFEIFEHLRINPIFTMREIWRVLKPNGILFLSTPNLKSIYGLKNFIFKDRAYSCCGDIYSEFMKLETLGHMGHVREYTVTEVIDFLKKIGFEIDKIIYRGRINGIISKFIIRIFPALRPFVTYIARKISN